MPWGDDAAVGGWGSDPVADQSSAPTRASVKATYEADPRWKSGSMIDRAHAMWDATAPIRNAPLENPVEATANAFHAAHVAFDADAARATQPVKIKRGLGKLIPGADPVEGGNPVGAMVGDVAGMITSPVTGLINSAYVDPVSKFTGLPKQDVRLSLMALGPEAGGAKIAAGAEAVSPTARAVRTFAQRAKPNLADLEARATEYRAAGIEPTLTDVTDETGRGMIRAAASRPTPGRQVAQDFGDQRALNLPDRMSRQARDVMSADPRTPDQIAEDLAKARGVTADQQFGAVRKDALDMPPETVQALRTDYGRDAVAEAARRERDPDVRAALNRLSGDALDDPSTKITVGMADRVSRVLLGQAQAAARAGDMDLSGTLSGLGKAIRGPAKAVSPGYADALANYGAHSSLIDAAGTGEGLMKRNTDEFVAATSAMTPEERAVARASGRRAIERAAGESIGAAPGVARRLADAPEQQARNEALLGPEDATRLQDNMRLEGRAVVNAQQIAPKTGSWTAQNLADAETLGTAKDAVGMVGKGARGDVVGAAFDGAKLWLKARGLNDASAEELVRIATDPARTAEAFRLLQAHVGPSGARAFMTRYRIALRKAFRPAVLIGAEASGRQQSPTQR